MKNDFGIQHNIVQIHKDSNKSILQISRSKRSEMMDAPTVDATFRLMIGGDTTRNVQKCTVILLPSGTTWEYTMDQDVQDNMRRFRQMLQEVNIG
jgi:hypothetical protein